jgi:hypothetical protein
LDRVCWRLVGKPACFETSAYSQPLQRIALDMPKLLEDAPLAVTSRTEYMHHGVPAHFRHAVRDILNNAYHD